MLSMLLAEGLGLGSGIALVGTVIGSGLAVLGAAFGIGRMADSACQATARQPEASGDIFKTMLIAAALVEGVTLFCLVIAFMVLGKV